MSCGEIWGHFGENWEIMRKTEPKKYICGEKMTNMRSDSKMPNCADILA